jgi:fibronectin-binding autotransporter adhesin
MRYTKSLLLTGVILAAVLPNGSPVRGVAISVPTTLATPGTNNKLSLTVKASTPVGSPTSTRVLDMTGGFTTNLNVDFNSATRAATVNSLAFQEDPVGNVYITNNDPKGNFDLKWTILFWSYHEYVGMSNIRATPASPNGFTPVTGTSFDMSRHQVRMNSGTISWWGDFDTNSLDCGLNPIWLNPPAGTTGTLEVTKASDNWTSSSYNVHILTPISFTDMPVTSGSVSILGDYTVTDSGSGTMESNGTFTQSFTPTAAYWDTSTTSGLQAGSGTWSASATSWSPLAGGGNPLLGWYSSGSSLDVYFNASGTSTVTLGSSISAKTLTFNGTGYTVAGSGSSTLTLTGGTITANQNATVSAPLAGTYGLKKYGTADLTLSGSASNTYSGATTVYAGRLLLAKTGAAQAIANSGLTIGDGTNPATVLYTGTSTDMMGAGTVTINRNGTLDFNGQTDTIGGVVLYGNNSSIGQIGNTAGGGALNPTALSFYGGGKVDTNTGKIVLNGNVSYNTASGGVAATVLGNVDLNATRTFSVADDAALASEMNVSAALANGSGTGGLIKAGAGTLTMSGSTPNTYSGPTTVNSGTLLLAKTSGNAIAGGGLTIGDNNNTAIVKYDASGTSTDMMGAGAVTINRLGTLNFNGKTDTIGNVTLYGNTSSIGLITNSAGIGALTVGTLSFVGGGRVLTDTGKMVLGGDVSYATAASGAAATISGNVDLNAVRTFTIADDATVTSEMDVSALLANGSGTGGLIKSGAGTLTLSGTVNTYSGATTVNAGTLLLAKLNGNAIAGGGLTIGDGTNVATVQYAGTSGDMMGTGAVTINRNGTLDFNGKTDAIGNVSLLGNNSSIGQISNTGANGTLTVNSLGFSGGGNVATGSGKIVLGGNVTYTTAASGAAATISGKVDLNANRTFTIADDAGLGSELIISAVIANGAGVNGFVKDGLGKMTLTGDNTFSGDVTISGGTLALAGEGQLPTSLVNNAGFEISDGTANRTVGAITGTGITQVLDSGQLISPSIVQGTLRIGGAGVKSGAQPVPEPSLIFLLATAGLGVLGAQKVRK